MSDPWWYRWYGQPKVDLTHALNQPVWSSYVVYPAPGRAWRDVEEKMKQAAKRIASGPLGADLKDFRRRTWW